MFYKICVGIVRILMKVVVRTKTVGKENVPKEGPFILAVNHKSNLDPVMAGITCPRPLKFMAKSELFKNKLFGGLIMKLGAFPVNRGTGDIGAIKAAFKIFKSGEGMLIFPEGGRVKNGVKRKAKPGVALMAQKACVPVIPVLIDGDYKWLGKITVRYGEPISFEEYRGEKLSGEEIQQLASGVLDEIYKLGQGEVQ